MDKLKSLFKISWFGRKKDVEISTSEEPILAGCPEEYVELPVSALGMKTRQRLAKYLAKKGKLLKVEIENVPTEIMNDLTGLAKLSGHEGCLDTVDFKNQVKNPTMTLLDRWIIHGVTIGKFWEYLLILQRHDVIHDCRQIIMSDCQKNLDQTKNPAMAKKIASDIPFVSPHFSVSDCQTFSDQKKNATMAEKGAADNDSDTFRRRLERAEKCQYSDTSRHRLESPGRGSARPMADLFPPLDNGDYSMHFTFNAFVCYNQDDSEDQRFVQDLIKELEGRRGLRLYVPGRDDLLHASEHINNAGDIERSCRRVIIVLSKSFLQSRYFVFQEQFAQELSTGERRERMIAVIREGVAAMPSTLSGCNTLDYNDLNERFLLISYINTPITQTTYMEFRRNRNRRGLGFPWPAGAHENTEPKEVTPSRNVQHLADPNGSPDHTTPKVVVSPLENVRPPGVSRSSAPIAPAIRTDLQLLQKERNIRESVQEGGDINVHAPSTHIETSMVHEDET